MAQTKESLGKPNAPGARRVRSGNRRRTSPVRTPTTENASCAVLLPEPARPRTAQNRDCCPSDPSSGPPRAATDPVPRSRSGATRLHRSPHAGNRHGRSAVALVSRGGRSKLPRQIRRRRRDPACEDGPRSVRRLRSPGVSWAKPPANMKCPLAAANASGHSVRLLRNFGLGVSSRTMAYPGQMTANTPASLTFRHSTLSAQ